MKLKIFKRLFFTTSLVFFIALTFVFIIFSVAVNNVYMDTRSEILASSCRSVIDVLSHKEYSRDSAKATINTIGNVNDIDVFLSDMNGKVVFCSCQSECNHLNFVIDKKYLDSAAVGGKIQLTNVGGLYDEMNYAVVNSCIDDSGKVFYVISVSAVVAVRDLLTMLIVIYALCAILPLAFMFIAEYALVSRFTRPLKYMSVAAKSIAKGDFTKRIPVISNDEIGELSVLFNRMTKSLSRTELASKNFVANVSHELRTPMTTISGFIDGIIDGTIPEDKHSYYLNLVSVEVKRLSRLVQSMLGLAQLESDNAKLNKTDFRLSDVVLNIAVSMEQRIEEKQICVDGLEDMTETVICADKDLLYQVIYNLTDNAVKFTEIGGSITFSLKRIDNSLVFSIANSGNSISDKDLPHIFEKFYKVDKSRSNHKDSLGLGLYICKTVVELHEGTISADSKDGEFTRFTLSIPIKDQNGVKYE